MAMGGGATGRTGSMYEISEMAHLFGVSRQTLIYYDHIGLFPPAYVNDKGYRFYAPTQIPAMRLICLLRDLGLELKTIQRIMATGDLQVINECLEYRLARLDEEIALLQTTRVHVAERLDFYREAAWWRERAGKPLLLSFPERYVVCEPYPEGPMDRSKLHPTLMRAADRLYQRGMQPFCGWGSVLLRKGFHTDDPIAGASSFVVVPGEIDPKGLDDVTVVPEGVYLCQARWGMPYDPAGIRAMVALMDEHGLEPVGDAYDFCLLDTAHYDTNHHEDFCCLQIPVRL